MKECEMCNQKFEELRRYSIMSVDYNYSRRIRELSLCKICVKELRRRHSIKIMELD